MRWIMCAACKRSQTPSGLGYECDVIMGNEEKGRVRLRCFCLLSRLLVDCSCVLSFAPLAMGKQIEQATRLLEHKLAKTVESTISLGASLQTSRYVSPSALLYVVNSV
jgi:hypothetical protein